LKRRSFIKKSRLLGSKIFFALGFMLILFSPAAIHAGFFSFFEQLFSSQDNSSFVYQVFNVQTLPLLASPYTADLKAGRGGGGITVVGGSALLSVTGPLGSLVDVEAEERRSTAISVYVVREGDTLSDIARMFDVTVNTIIWANDIKRGNIIQPGDLLIILPISGLQYTVKKGDTLSGITKRYKGDIDEIIAYNGLPDNVLLTVGQIIIIPNGESDKPSVSPSGRVVRGGGPAYFGYYLRPISGSRRSQGLHGYNAVDLAQSCGAPVRASASGRVIVARSFGWNGGYGKYLVVNHLNGTQTLYAHLNSMIVGNGWNVVQGQVIGYIGSTGLSTGCHVHFEIRGAKNPF